MLLSFASSKEEVTVLLLRVCCALSVKPSLFRLVHAISFFSRNVGTIGMSERLKKTKQAHQI